MERNWSEVRAEVKDFVENEVYPAEAVLEQRNEESTQKQLLLGRLHFPQNL